MRRAYYSSSIADFLSTSPNEIIGELTRAHAHNLDQTQLHAWLEQINILTRLLINRSGRIYFEYAIPRMGKRIDVLLLIGPVIFVFEFKVGESHFTSSALDQVTDYCLDLKNFRESSYDSVIAPILVATASRHAMPIVCSTRGSSPTIREGSTPESGAFLDSRATAPASTTSASSPWFNDKLLTPIRSTVFQLGQAIDDVLGFSVDEPDIDPDAWEQGRYCPTPTIIEPLLHQADAEPESQSDST